MFPLKNSAYKVNSSRLVIYVYEDRMNPHSGYILGSI